MIFEYELIDTDDVKKSLITQDSTKTELGIRIIPLTKRVLSEVGIEWYQVLFYKCIGVKILFIGSYN